MHPENVGAMSFSFPPAEMPTHAMRRALIAAIQIVQSRNQAIADVNQRDWVSVITFDKTSATSPKIEQALTSNYGTVMTACTRLQAVSDTALSTCSEAGLDKAYNHLKFGTKSGDNCWGREHTNKIVVLLTDGQPNLKLDATSNTTINDYATANPSTWWDPVKSKAIDNWAVTGGYTTEKRAALRQTAMMQSDHWYVYAAGVGLDCDTDFMDRLARLGSTANQGHAPTGGGNPNTYEANVTEIFNKIVTNPKLRLVQ